MYERNEAEGRNEIADDEGFQSCGEFGEIPFARTREQREQDHKTGGAAYQPFAKELSARGPDSDPNASKPKVKADPSGDNQGL